MNSASETNRTPAWIFIVLLVSVIIAGSSAFTALLLSQTHARQRFALEQEAKTRAAFASVYVDQAVANLARGLSLLPSAVLTTESSRQAFYARADEAFDGSGITILARDKNLSAFPLAKSAENELVLDAVAKEAAVKALRDGHPQLTSYGDGSAESGENLWVAIAPLKGDPIIVQARIPAKYFTTTLKNLDDADAWFLAIVKPDGHIIARNGTDAKFATISFAAADGGSNFAQSLATTSKFGFRVAAAMPFAILDANSVTSWSWFILIMTLLTTLSIAGSSSIRNRLAEEFAHVQHSARSSVADVTNRLSSQSPLQNAQRLQSALDAGSIGTWAWQEGSAAVAGDATTAALVGLPPGVREQQVMSILKRIAAPDRATLLRASKNAVAEGDKISLDIRFRDFNGTSRWFALRASGHQRGDGIPANIGGLVYDVTEQRQSQAKTAALLREVSHRTKNLLALILAMARLTARDNIDTKTHVKQFARRVAGLSASQDLIVASDWQSADLAALAHAEVDAVARGSASRILIAGPSLAVSPEAAQTLGIIIAELTLNALEHGALSTTHGEGRLSWSLPDQATFRMTWREQGGPAYDSDAVKKYGMTIVDRLATQGLKAKLTLGQNPAGLEWSLEAPLSAVAAELATDGL